MKPDLSLSDFASFNGRQTFEHHGLVIVGMSPGNSYFKESIISDLLICCSEHFTMTRIFVPALSSRHTFRALGYDEKAVVRNARLDANTLVNRSKRVIKERGLTTVDVIDCDGLTKDPTYAQAYRSVMQLYNNDQRFKHDADESTRAVLSHNPFLKNALDDAAVAEGVHYLLEELAFITASPKLLGQERITFVYHRPWPIYQRYVAGMYDGVRKKDLGFLIIA
eukprot:TRINITY_DN6476_c0_g1_i1.p1 TRINITY_DN6476_c0_g1~~TRINITY_DN6476_c0_g1_i1.p1  ORF type:complete len:223 (+),score=25.41 TRINITY_DN6476_c0_g1_i1:48-716(+)